MSSAQLNLGLSTSPSIRQLFDDGTLRIDADEKDRVLSWYPVLRGADQIRIAEGRFVRVISKPAGGQIRGYLLHNRRLYLWLPDAVGDWPELDAEVSRVTGHEVVS